MFALVDVNNTYVSCERVFQPRLNGKPVVVLSSNDGACIARSNEAKALGVKVAQPWFQVRHLERSAGLVALSANFELYSDLSNRMMTVVSRFAPEQEVYSIDESFLGCAGLQEDLATLGHRLRAAVLQETGLPTSVGFGATKTLAKLANHAAKTADRIPGSFPAKIAKACDLSALDQGEFHALLAACSVADVWGVGRRLAPKLLQGGIRTALDLMRANPAVIRRQFSIVLEKTVLELQGRACLELTDMRSEPNANQQILVSRSFGTPLMQVEGIVEAVSEFTSRAAERLRAQNSVAATLSIFFTTSAFRQSDAQHQVNVTLPLGRPTADTAVLVDAAVRAVRANFRSGYRYAKAGAMLVNLSSADSVDEQLDLFCAPVVSTSTQQSLIETAEASSGTPKRNRDKLMAAMDSLNKRFGRDSVYLGATTLASQNEPVKAWATKQERRSPRYTTRWDEMPTVKS